MSQLSLDKVHREALYAAGCDASVQSKVGAVDSELESSIEVRQNLCEGPVMFLVIMQAALETMIRPVAKPRFTACANGVTMAKRTGGQQGSTAAFKHCVP